VKEDMLMFIGFSGALCFALALAFWMDLAGDSRQFFEISK